MNYVAYGSNMNTQQMKYRCPDAKLLGTGYIHGAQLEFYLHATVVPARNADTRVPVAVWEISPADEQKLDRYEGFPRYYLKATCMVDMGGGQRIKGMLYVMNDIRILPPDPWYYNSIREAYVDLGLNADIPKVLQPALMRSHRKRYA